ncbi:MAG: replicative DNA helicase [Phycisphaerales bacterium]
MFDWSTGASSSGGAGEGGSAGGEASGRGRGAFRPQFKLTELFDKPPPQAPEAEMALLGAMILEPRVTGDVIMLIKSPSAFYQEAHGAIFQALVTLYDRHQAGDLVQLVDMLRDKEVLSDVGGINYLEKLARETPGAAGATHWARIVAEKGKLRSLIETAGTIIHNAYTLGQGSEDNAGEIIDKAEQQIFEISRKHELFEPQSMAELVQIEFERLEAMQGKGVSGVASGYYELDKMTSGFQPGEMIIIAARPSMGKTALALNLAEQVALGGIEDHQSGKRVDVPVGFFSLEMSKSAIAQRLLSSRSGVGLQDMRAAGTLDRESHDRMLRKILGACEELHDSPIYIDDMPGLTVMGLRARARRMVQQYGVKMIFIDYLQLMTAPAFAKESRQVEVSAISRGIKALARELNMPIVCLSQLNRGPESRSDNKPRMSDLRESGAIEQDADVIMLLHREEYYHVGDASWANDPDNMDKIGVAEIIVAKQRNGPTGVVELKWDAETTRFKNLARSSRGGYAPDESWPGADAGATTRYNPTRAGGATGGGGGGGGAGGGAPNSRTGVRIEPKTPGSGLPVSGYDGGGYADDVPFDADDPVPPRAVGGSEGGGTGGRSYFATKPKAGPEENFRDGGGPEREDDVPSEPDEDPT